MDTKCHLKNGKTTGFNGGHKRRMMVVFTERERTELVHRYMMSPHEAIDEIERLQQAVLVAYCSRGAYHGEVCEECSCEAGRVIVPGQCRSEETK